ncbi:GPR1/FUN34/YaaH family transporter [Streptomyces beihaiensis]|uniref:Acetate uptake transporter family protein n=1 Tax=Streptomyces beihaiensis TaxID=2984495 RepID=A0ABT3TS46_9ACTN|nr:GPR1/FUN34/YaaH family transporter [Streptomyces beihaiensis]MCX3058843.1 acetate uptake transporter family protein [Streptomyces beihaiensis]
MDNDVSAGSTASAASVSTLGQLALGITLLAFGLGHTQVIHGVTAADAVSIATYVGGVALFVAGLFALREGGLTGAAYAALGAFWFTWGVSSGAAVSANAAGLFMLLFALLALSLTVGSAGAGTFVRGTYGAMFVAFVLLAVAAFGDTQGLAKAGGWIAAVGGLLAWYGATAAVGHLPTALPGRAAGRGVTAHG